MTTPDLAIEVTGRRKRYGDKQAVDGLDLAVHRGEIFAVLGPNGAGKTTTVEIFEGFRNRDGGSVSVLGIDPATADRAWRSRIGIVLQTANYQAELTVHELVHHFAHYYPDPRDPDEMIDSVGRGEKAGTRTRQLSGGQRRRLDVALGIIGRPELLFLDEPTRGSTRTLDGRSGTCWTAYAKPAPPCSSRPTTSTRPSSWPTGSPSCMTAGCWRSTPPRTWARARLGRRSSAGPSSRSRVGPCASTRRPRQC